ncbi:hypothetical protein [Pseudomonas sp. 1 R 17]|uniref:hypothetical protein n=1 Tax=Pseudomonas sp. 1 R 17 TaxID=1844091 RepID=UPI00081C01CE|nr:hypothetical protein [Pseudomonas sp. 1 R 17]
MKQAVMAVVLGFGVAGMTGCAELQQQAGAFLPQQQQAVGTEGGQTVKTLGAPQSNQGSAQNTVAQEGSSVVSDMTKEASSTLKNEVSSSIRSAIRGAFSR